MGDNVVWQAPDPADIEPFVEAFLATAHGDTPLTYLSFRLPPAAVLDRFGQVWDSDRFTLLDGWTGSQHASSEPSVAVAGVPPQALVRRLKDPTDMEQVNRELSEIEDELGPGARYVFDDLTSMQRLWGPEPALALFLRCCPRLYQERTVAYWLLERDAHPPTFRSQLADITQVILDLDTTATQPAERTLQVVKADGHSPPSSGAPSGTRSATTAPSTSSAQRLAHVSASASRSAPNASPPACPRLSWPAGSASAPALVPGRAGRHGLSGETLTRLWATLGIPFGPAASPASPPYRLARRGARQSVTPAPGVSGETVVQEPSGLAVHELTFAANSSGRRPFETKQPELLLILEGALELQLGQDTHTLQQGDAILLATQPVTGWRNPARNRHGYCGYSSDPRPRPPSAAKSR